MRRRERTRDFFGSLEIVVGRSALGRLPRQLKGSSGGIGAGCGDGDAVFPAAARRKRGRGARQARNQPQFGETVADEREHVQVLVARRKLPCAIAGRRPAIPDGGRQLPEQLARFQGGALVVPFDTALGAGQGNAGPEGVVGGPRSLGPAEDQRNASAGVTHPDSIGLPGLSEELGAPGA